MFSLLESETPAYDYIESVVGTTTRKETLKNQMFSELNIQEDTEYKGILFFMLFGSAIEQQGPFFIFEQYKTGNIIIYQETIMFKLIKFIPSSLVYTMIKAVGDNNGNNG